MRDLVVGAGSGKVAVGNGLDGRAVPVAIDLLCRPGRTRLCSGAPRKGQNKYRASSGHEATHAGIKECEDPASLQW